MPDHCCLTMQSQCRTRWRDQPEEEKSDASIEYDPDGGYYIIANSNGNFTFAIYHCPWCGTPLPPNADEIESLERASKAAYLWTPQPDGFLTAPLSDPGGCPSAAND